MPRSICLALVLLALAVGGGLAFAAAAGQAAIGPPLAAKAVGPTASDAAAPSGAAAAGAGAGDASQAGERIGDIVKSWGTALLLSVAGLMGIVALGKRSVGEGLTVLVIVLIVGGFIYAPEQVKGFIQSIWRPLAGG
ncbi:MAG TPA: hypothetical protein VGM91_23345 [Conexibacter sp.]